MGSTYVNVTVVGPDHDEVIEALGDNAAFVSATVDDATVIAAAVDEMDGMGQGMTAQALSGALGCVALEVLVFDEDLLQYQLFVGGDLADAGAYPAEIAEEMSMGGDEVPVGDPVALVDRLGRGDAAEVARVLSDDADFVFATDRHHALVEALGLPVAAVGWGYRYLIEEGAGRPEGFEVAGGSNGGNGRG